MIMDVWEIRLINKKFNLKKQKNFQVDYYKILNEGESNRRCYEEEGKIVLVTENDAKSNKHKVLKSP